MSFLATSEAAGAGLLGVFGLIIFLVIAGIYFVPTILAFARNKSNKIAILALNFFLGWSLIGWVISLVWALSQDQQPTIVQQTFHQGTFVPTPTGQSVVEASGES